MANLKIVVQQPSIELPVSSADASNASVTILVGFKRYETAEARKRTEVYEEIVNAEGFDMLDSAELEDFLKEEILYIRKVNLPVTDTDTGEESFIKVPDTRKAKKVETLWDTSEECLVVLLDAYFQWTSWKVSFIQEVQAALLDSDILGDARKN